VRHEFLVVTVKKIIKIGPHLPKLSSKYLRGSVFWNTR